MLSRWWNRILLSLIILLTVFSIITVWPGNPNRYLPNAIPWPEGTGWPLTIKGKEIPLKLPRIEGGTFGLGSVIRKEMSLGLDLRGGTRLILQPAEGTDVADLRSALEGARKVIELRVNAFGVAESEVNILGNDQLSVQLPGIDPQEAKDKIGRTALLQFCEPVTNEAGNVLVARQGTVKYKPQSCDPVRNDNGDVVVETAGAGAPQPSFEPWPAADYTNDQIVWQPAVADLDGDGTNDATLDGQYLKPDTFVDAAVTASNPLGNPTLIFSLRGDGGKVAEQITSRLSRRQYPLAPFLDGEPIRGEDNRIIAPAVQSTISSQGTITGLTIGDAKELSTLLNTGAFPVPLEVVLEQSVDSTLGETTVRDSVIAGEVALLLIMFFMIAYYRLPGLMASLALICYTSFVLAIFKLWPITLTLAGVAAFILSVGMAVDANILIFERMKEELRIGRNLITALEDGFNRAWSSIRDSNISTLITCVILYWFGNQFDESSIKGFAITLGIGVLVSLFSAITVTRTFMRVIIGNRAIARRLSLFAADLPEHVRRDARGLPAVAGGANGESKEMR
ncbi:MAG: protein translocase subunit SecD [Dehalococcoidia bacterium]